MATASVRNARKTWTYRDYARLDDENRYEIIEGELLMAPAPGSFHQQVSANLLLIFLSHVKRHRLGRVFAAPTDVILDNENVVQPDLLFITAIRAGIIQKEAIVGRPDVVVEILSPTTVQRDRLSKKQLYQDFRVPEYWLVDPANQTIEVFVLSRGKYQPFGFAAESGKVKSKIIEGLEVDLADALS